MPRSAERETFYAQVLWDATHSEPLFGWARCDEVLWYFGPDDFTGASPQRQGGANVVIKLTDIKTGMSYKLTPADITRAFKLIHTDKAGLSESRKGWYAYIWREMDSSALSINDLKELLQIAVFEGEVKYP